MTQTIQETVQHHETLHSLDAAADAALTGCAVSLLIGATIEDIERELIVQTLARCGGNRTHAAHVLGMSVRTLRNKIRQYAAIGVEVPAHH